LGRTPADREEAFLGEVLYGRVFNIQRFSLQDGPGLRTTVFFKGCPLACAWCHNPEGQALECEIVTVETRCIQCGTCKKACPSPSLCIRCGACANACPTGARQLIGRDVTSAELVAEVVRDRPFFDESCGGVTFSGGEPLLQTPFLLECLAQLAAAGVHAALDTCGFAPREDLLEAAALADVVLYDLKLIDAERHLAATGKRNERIMANLAALGAIHKAIWIRIPVVPGLNDDEANLDATARIAASTPGVCRVDLLPYHPTGAPKFARLGMPFRLEGVEEPSAERMRELAEGFRGYGIPVTIGGRA
jgi:pyruvate formate lyase activating enzyme